MDKILENKWALAAIAFLLGNAAGYAMYAPSDTVKCIEAPKKDKKKKKKDKADE